MDELEIADFLKRPGVFIDVRSPIEFEQGRIPGSFNLPLFTNEERALIGTLYKEEGKARAFEKGLEIVGPKLVTFIQEAKTFSKGAPLKIYCARGGLRSHSLEWLLKTAGFLTSRLRNGYKAFRKFVLDFDFQEPPLIVIGGLSGSSKTTLLKELNESSENQIIDLEALSCHRGSVFGMIPGLKQPSNEQFENELVFSWLNLDLQKKLYIEDESQKIGNCRLPVSLLQIMQNSKQIFIDKPFKVRLKKIVEEYGMLEKEILIKGVNRLSKQLGALKTQEVIHYIESGYLEKAAEILLKYYDSAYLYGIKKKNQKFKKNEMI